MTQVYVKYNPYRLKTTFQVNGRDIPENSRLYAATEGKRLQEWIGDFPRVLSEEYFSDKFVLEFCGLNLDWDDFKYAFEQAKLDGIVDYSCMDFKRKNDEDINERITAVFRELQEGPLDDFRDPKLVRAFEVANNAVFPVNVIATMSSGKSTLINAMLCERLMPFKNEACTATITEILDTDDPAFHAKVYNGSNQITHEVENLTLEIMSKLNSDDNVHRISVEGDIPFLDSATMALMLVDTPGPNNAQNQAHKNMTYRAINNDSNSLILYVLNGTQLSTTDDAELLRYVAEQMKKGGKQVRDRFLFVVNKMDEFDPEEEDIGKAVLSAKRYLAIYGIENPQIFPCSAFAALNLRTILKDVDIDNLTRADIRALPAAAKDTIPMYDKFTDSEHDSMHLEKYTTLSPSVQQELEKKRIQAACANDNKELALIHCGIYSVEAAITAYVKKYAKTKKVKDLVESFNEVLRSSEVLTKAKARVATDEAAARACAERAAFVRKKIADGKDAEAFRSRINSLNPMLSIRKRADQLKQTATIKTSVVFRPYGEKITSREDVKRLINQFSSLGSSTMAELTSELESVINREIIQTGEQLLLEYQSKVSRIDDSCSGGKLDFRTVDLVKGKLNAMREDAKYWTSDDFVSGTVDEIGESTYEVKTIYEKVGTQEKKVLVGSHEEKVGTRQVKIGSHREKVGTRQVPNPEKRWWKLFTPRFVEEDVYRIVDDFKTEDVYKTVMDYKTVVEDVFKERKETIEKFSVATAKVQQVLVSQMRRNLDEGIEGALAFAAKQVEHMKKQFADIFAALDRLIDSKYRELEACAADQNEKEAALAENQRILAWIEEKITEIDSILDME